MPRYDCIIIGGGPAGLSAGLHLGWHGRQVLVIDRRTGPLFFTLEKLYNVPGMPATSGIDIQRQLRQQAIDRGAEVVRTNVTGIEGEIEDFRVLAEPDQTWQARTLLLATGLARYHPTVDGDYRPCFRYAGKGNMYYCPDCEAPEVTDKELVVIGTASADGAGGMALGLSTYAESTRLLLTGETALSQPMAKRLRDRKIDVIEGRIARLVGERTRLLSLELEDGRQVEAEAFFVSSPVVGRTELARLIGVEMAATDNHAQPASQRGDTNVPGVWVAGDLRPMTQQVAVAMGTGNIAAVMIDQYLRKQKLTRT